MASEDVFTLRVCNEDGEVYDASHPRIQEQFDALAAEVRELRKDKARLDWVLNDDFARYDPRQKEYIGLIEDREDIDAAMAGEG
jgi:hypothetical protein